MGEFFAVVARKFEHLSESEHNNQLEEEVTIIFAYSPPPHVNLKTTLELIKAHRQNRYRVNFKHWAIC